MKTLHNVALLGGLLFWFCLAGVKSQESESDFAKFGLGASLFNLAEYTYENELDPISTVYFTFNLSEGFRLEPSIGFILRENNMYAYLGLGAFKVKPISKFNMIYGGSAFYVDDLLVAPSIGGEYLFIKNFSVGSEIQLRLGTEGRDWLVYSNTYGSTSNPSNKT